MALEIITGQRSQISQKLAFGQPFFQFGHFYVIKINMRQCDPNEWSAFYDYICSQQNIKCKNSMGFTWCCKILQVKGHELVKNWLSDSTTCTFHILINTGANKIPSLCHCI
jgi:hypothetical protein